MNKINIVISLLNLVVVTSFWYRFAYPIAETSAGFLAHTDSISALLAAQANHHALLQLYLVGLSIVLALGAIWGYSQIKNEVITIALAKINDTVPNEVQKTLTKLGPEALSEMLVKLKMQTPSTTNDSDKFGDVKQILGDPDEQRFP